MSAKGICMTLRSGGKEGTFVKKFVFAGCTLADT